MNTIPVRFMTTAGLWAALTIPAFAASAAIGESAPDFALTDIQGNTHQLSEYVGQTVVLEWVNPECPFVRKHYRSGNIPMLQSQAKDDDVVWITINSGSPGAQGDFDESEVRSWMERTDANPHAYCRDQDGKVGRLYGAKTTPHMYVINSEGTLVYNGAIDNIPSANARDLDRAENYVVAALAAIESGEMPDRSTSQPYGCSVKY